jgi:predicted alpha/beta hydrolase family esterase
VVLVPDHGLFARAHWLLQARLEAAGETVSPAPGARSIEAAAEYLGRHLAALPESAAEVVLLGIGTGGLVARHLLRRRAPARVRRLFTVGCPHGGTSPRLALLRGWREAQSDGPTFRRLTAADHIPDQFAVTAVAADLDAWIVPSRNHDYPGAFNISVRGLGHAGLLASHRTVELLVENLDA